MSDREKWEFLRSAPERDSKNPRIRELAANLGRACQLSTGDKQRRQRRFVELARTVAGAWIRQVIDTDRIGGEDIAGFTTAPTADDAVDALDRGVDDCDAKARLFCALCLAVGIPAQMVPQWRDDDLTHVFASVLLAGAWLPVELTLARAVLGEYGTDVPKETNGKWKLT